MKHAAFFKGLRHCLILHSAFSILHCGAAPLEWECDWPGAKSQQFSLYHGESATFRPRWRVNGVAATNIAVEAVYVQTNGMADAWWTLDGATFAPSNDVGAAQYRFFLRASDGSGILYRANGTLRMLDSPGFEPAAVALPTKRLDFAGIDVVNAPWPQAVSNIVTKSFVEDLGISGGGGEPGDYANVSNKAVNAVQPEALAGATNALAAAVADGYIPSANSDLPTLDLDWLFCKRTESGGISVFGLVKDYLLELAEAAAAVSTPGDYASVSNKAVNAVQPAQLDDALDSMMDDVRDEITLRLTSTNAYISVSNGVTRIYEVDGATRTLKWEWDMGFAAISNQVAELVTQMAGKIDNPRRWADWGASGLANTFPDAVALDRAAVYFGSTNVTWATSGGFAVLTSHMPATASGTASQFRIGVDADDWFGMEVTASYLVDAHADSFSVVDAAGGKTATITTDYDASFESTSPVVYYTQALGEPFAQLNTGVSWSHNASTGVSTVTILGLTGASGGKLAENCAVSVIAPANTPADVQEYHLPIYHALCAMLESHFFEE